MNSEGEFFDMDKLNLDVFKLISKVIERDSKDTTYKFALLKGVIEISLEYSHLKRDADDRVKFPLGLLIEKWLLYYYPLIESAEFIPQKHGENIKSKLRIAFRNDFKKITDYYSDKGGFSVFYNDYLNGKIPDDIIKDFSNLVKKLKRTITLMPMRYLGRSVSKKEYSIFTYDKVKKRLPQNISISQEFLVKNLGTFSFPRELYEVFQYVGSFISGEDSLLYKWAEFSHNVEQDLEFEYIFKKLRTLPTTERAIDDAKSVYKKLFERRGHLECVWSGKTITKFGHVHVDHVIPFSIWKNNDLWNLIPTHKIVNKKKGDKIPSPELMEKRSELITYYWHVLRQIYPARFRREITLSLVGREYLTSNDDSIAISSLKKKCNNLINLRGFDKWE